ncbi:MAG: hypothetical protein QOF14_5202 [Hyphomicrobiales bacterium]|nr:hypothetical protein [Hyphomicrobiales bacterium]
MTREPRHISWGTPMSTWIEERIPRPPYDELPLGMWAIVDDGRRLFGLEGEALAGYIRKSIYALMDAGFKPVCGVGKNRWQLQVQYGSSKQEVAEAVIAEWLREGAKTPEPWTGLWFGLPRHWLPEK